MYWKSSKPLRKMKCARGQRLSVSSIRDRPSRSGMQMSEENHVHLVFPEDGQGVRPGIGPEHNGPVPVILLQLGGKPLHNVGLVIHNQDGLHAVSSFRSRRSTSVAQKPPRLPRETVRSPPRSFMRPLTFFSAVTFSPMFSSSR